MVKVKKNDIDQYNKPFPTILRKHLEAPGITQQLLADYVGVKRQTVSQWKNGDTIPDIEGLSKIADFFGVNTDYLLGRAENPSNNIDNRAITERTGLSNEAIEILEKCNNFYKENSIIRTINKLIIERNVLQDIGFYLYYQPVSKYHAKNGEPLIQIDFSYDKGSVIFDQSQDSSNGLMVDAYTVEAFKGIDVKRLILLRIQSNLEEILSGLEKGHQ